MVVMGEVRLQDTCGKCQGQVMLVPLRITCGSLFYKDAIPHLKISTALSLVLFGNSLYLIQSAFWAGSSSLCSSNSGLDFITLIFLIYHAAPVPSQFLFLGVLIMYECKIYLYFTVSSSICLLHYFKHQQKYLPYIELWQQWGFGYFFLSFVIMQLQCLYFIFISYLIYALLA